MAGTIQPYIGKRVLETGAGIGNLTRILCPRREYYIAADIDAEYLAQLRARFQHRPKMEVRRCDLANPADFAPLAGTMDTVVCLNVLEHVEGEMASLRNIYGAFQPGGRAVILVPHGQSIYGSLDTALGHSAATLTTNSAEDGAGRISGGAHSGLQPGLAPGLVREWPPAERKTIGRFQLRLFDSLIWLWRRIDPIMPWPSTSIIAIGVRPDGV